MPPAAAQCSHARPATFARRASASAKGAGHGTLTTAKFSKTLLTLLLHLSLLAHSPHLLSRAHSRRRKRGEASTRTSVLAFLSFFFALLFASLVSHATYIPGWIQPAAICPDVRLLYGQMCDSHLGIRESYVTCSCCIFACDMLHFWLILPAVICPEVRLSSGQMCDSHLGIRESYVTCSCCIWACDMLHFFLHSENMAHLGIRNNRICAHLGMGRSKQ